MARQTTRKRSKDVTTTTPRDSDDVSELLHSIANTLKKRGLCDWKLDDVSGALKKSMGIFPVELREKVERDFDSHVLTLLGLLTDKKARVGKKATGKRAKDILVSVADDSLLEALSKESKRSVVADLVASRVPADLDGMRALVEDGNDDEIQKAMNYIRVCSSLGGRCSSTDEGVASFALFAVYMKQVETTVDFTSERFEYEGMTGTDAFLRVLQSAIGSIHAMILRGENQDLSSSLTSWKSGTKQSMPPHLHASLICYDIMSILVKLRSLTSTSLNEEAIGNMVSSIQHMMHIVSPYASLGLLVSRAKDKEISTSMEDLIMFLSCSKEGLSCGREGLKVPVYILYMNVARQVISLAHEKGFASLASSLERMAGDTMPPVSLQQWLTSQPPSAIIQVLLDASKQGLKEVSRYIIHSMKEREMQALTSLSYSELAEGYQPDEDKEHAMDDLLFYESTQGEFNLLPQQWDDDDDEAIDSS